MARAGMHSLRDVMIFILILHVLVTTFNLRLQYVHVVRSGSTRTVRGRQNDRKERHWQGHRGSIVVRLCNIIIQYNNSLSFVQRQLLNQTYPTLVMHGDKLEGSRFSSYLAQCLGTPCLLPHLLVLPSP